MIAERWEVTAALVEGQPSGEFLDLLRHEVPRQEAGRFDSRVLVLTRGNRSVRFFDYLTNVLAAGKQPDPDLVADAGYIQRSTAFYANGKYGMRSFEGYSGDHPLRVPYRAQFVCAWMFRELGYDLVEHCARAGGEGAAVAFDERWRRYFGLGNATGLGLVPFAFKHPRVIHAWVAIRELALADVRSLPGTDDLVARLAAWIERAHAHFVAGTSDDCRPFLNAVEVASAVENIRGAFELCRHDPLPFDALYRWSEHRGPETTELVVSLLLELHESDDDLIDEMLTVDEHGPLDPATTVGNMRTVLASRFAWLEQLELDEGPATSGGGSSATTPTSRGAPGSTRRAVTSPSTWRCACGGCAPRSTATATRPHPARPRGPSRTRLAAERLSVSDRIYGEPRDNACSAHYLPLLLQRFQLAMYGVDNFKPKSTDWLRVTLFQGAPRFSDLGIDVSDDWVLPARPGRLA